MKQWHDGPQVTHSLVDHIVKARSLSLDDRFLSPRWPEDLHDTFLLPDMDKATARIWKAIEAGETIGIVGDYDMDGTPAAVIMAQFFRLVGSDVHVILPTREEGYGFSTTFVDRLREKKVTLIITVDCGIRDSAAVEHANQHGCDVIITDHHECAELLPLALAIVDPKRV
ncbi:MAG TPA: DHH family phosphoesterase, partial [Patescibacteria group bacterium]